MNFSPISPARMESPHGDRLTRSSTRRIVGKSSLKERYMQRWHDLLQTIIQVLRDPAWSGIGGVCAFLSIPLSIFLAHRSPTQRRITSWHISKKNGEGRRFIKCRISPSFTRGVLVRNRSSFYSFYQYIGRRFHVHPSFLNVPQKKPYYSACIVMM